jgi:ElaB protein
MKETTQNPMQPPDSITTSASTEHGAFESGRSVVGKVSGAAHAVLERAEDRSAEIVDQAKRKAIQVYDRANKSVTEQYGKAMDYSRDNPGKTTLIAFGVGIGVGLLMANGISAPRKSRSGFVKPVKNALSSLAHDLFRYRPW